MSSQEEKILKIVPAIRMIMSRNSLKSGSFVPLDQLIVTDPEDMSLRLGRSISVFKGDADKILEDLEKSLEDLGQYIFIEDLGLLGLSANKAQVEQKLGTVRKQSRGSGLPDSASNPQIPKALYNKVIAITGGAMG